MEALWERTVEALAPGSTPEAVRRAALGFGRLLREDVRDRGGLTAVDLAREARMRRVVASFGKLRVAAVTGAFHTPALAGEGERDITAGPAGADGADGAGPAVVTSLVPYAAALLDPRSGYPAGVRDPRWQQAVLEAGGDPARIRDTAARLVTEVCREVRASGHTAGTGEAIETLRLACDLGTSVTALRELLLVTYRLKASGTDPALIGTVRRRLRPEGPLRLYGVCREPVIGPDGLGGVVTHLVDDDGHWYTLPDVKPGGPARARRAGAPTSPSGPS